MEPLRVLLLEDKALVATEIEDIIRESGHSVVATVDNGFEAIASAQVLCPDVAVLDIKVNGSMTGIEVGRRLKEELNIPFVYLTDLDEMYPLAFNSKPHDFLPKPVNSVRLGRAMELAVNASRAEFKTAEVVSGQGSMWIVDNAVFIQRGDKKVRVELDEIFYIQAFKNYSDVFLKDIKFTISKPLKDVLHELHRINSGMQIIRVHKSYAVNSKHVRSIQGNMLHLDIATIDIGDTYRRSVLQRFPTL